MLPPPENLVVEIPGTPGGCSARCRHCIHRNVVPGDAPDLTDAEIVDLLTQGRAMGIPHLNIYPHQDDLCYVPAGRLARVAAARAKNPALRVHALVMVNRGTLDGIEERVARLVTLDLFQKIKMLELLPIGEAESRGDDALWEHAELDRLAALKARYAGQVRIGTPLWRVEAGGRRGCRLGHKDLVVGPQGQIAACTLLFYLNQILGNVRERPLAETWRTRFAHLRHKQTRPIPVGCRSCALYEQDLCWGGCLARRLIFGDEAEIARSCGVRDPDASRALVVQVQG